MKACSILQKIVDFGIAKTHCGLRDTQNLTQTGDVFGSPNYMSPEQSLGFELDTHSDIYSLGCLRYESLTGNSPFSGANAMQVIAKHLNQEPPRFTGRQLQISADLCFLSLCNGPFLLWDVCLRFRPIEVTFLQNVAYFYPCLYPAALADTICPLLAALVNLMTIMFTYHSTTHVDLSHLNTVSQLFLIVVNNPLFRIFIFALSVALINWLYHSILETTSGATWGKRITRLRLINTHGKSASLRQTALRHFSKPITLLLLPDICRVIYSCHRSNSLSSSSKEVLLQPIHDKLSGCLVVEKAHTTSPFDVVK